MGWRPNEWGNHGYTAWLNEGFTRSQPSTQKISYSIAHGTANVVGHRVLGDYAEVGATFFGCTVPLKHVTSTETTGSYPRFP